MLYEEMKEKTFAQGQIPDRINRRLSVEFAMDGDRIVVVSDTFCWHGRFNPVPSGTEAEAAGMIRNRRIYRNGMSEKYANNFEIH